MSSGTVGVPSRHDPADSLADIIENADRIEDYLAGMDRGALERDGRTRDAVERCLERLCEAAHRLGDQAGELIPGHPQGLRRRFLSPAAP